MTTIHKKIAGFQYDKVYIGTAEECAKQDMSDDNANLQLGAGHLVKLPGFTDGAPKLLQDLVKQDSAVEEYIKELSSKANNA